MRKLSVKNSDLKETSAQDILQECVGIMKDVFNQKGVEISLSLEADFDRIVVDKDEFIQAITNMMRNSLQAISGGGQIVLRTRNSETELEIQIEDSGSGISDDNQKLLFNKQFTTKSSEEGTGLGLGISRRFIRSFGGDIRLKSSEVGKTIFIVSIPLAKQVGEGMAA
jgi:signal transduction histidine kinase